MANEVVLNALLWDILKEGGIIDSQAEERNPDGSKTDIRCTIDDCVIAVEAEHGDSSVKKKSANQDADDKLRRRVCDLAIALVYPPQCNTRDDLLHSDLLVNVRTSDYQPKPKQTKWTAVKGTAMATFIQHAPNELGSPELLAKQANVAVNAAAARFSPEQSQSILAEMGESARGTNVKGLMTDLLTAIMFHTKLDEIRNQHFRPSNRPSSVAECLSDSARIVSAFHTAHRQWLAVDYKHILEWSCAVFRALPAGPNSDAAVKIIADAAVEIQSATGRQHHDLVGITFCQSVETAKSDGSMYTTIPAATLLTHLLFADLEIDWTDYRQVTSLRIVDFACGTGTLLIACANYILQREQTGQPDQVARALLEQMLYGFDVNNRAVFQTATGLGMMAPSVAFHKMHLYSLTLGLDKNGQARLGSLELLEGLGQLSLNPRPLTGVRIDADPAPIEVDKFHMAIMNPPYTRGDIRHKQLDPTTEKKLRQREAQLYYNQPIEHTGNSSGFLVLAEKHLNETGRVAVVMPSAISTNASAAKMRRWLSKRFFIKYIIVSYDPKRIFHSGNTNIGEMLLVLKRRKQARAFTQVIKLTTNPDKASGAAAGASKILEQEVEKHQWGVVDRIHPKQMDAGNWNAVQFVSNELYRIAEEITKKWNSTLGNQVKIQMSGGSVRRFARKCHPDAIYATPTLYDHNVEHCNKLEVEPDAHVQPQPDNTRALKYLQRRHRLKLANRIRLTTVKNFACRTTVPTVSAAWQSGVPILANCGPHSSEAVEKAIVVILNSTPGKLGMLLVRSTKFHLIHLTASKDCCECRVLGCGICRRRSWPV